MFPTLDGAYPLVGHLPEMYRRFDRLCARGERRHGPLFFIEGGPGARQLMCTERTALEVLKNPAASTSFYAEGFGALLSNTLFAFDGGEHRRVRGMMAPAFSPGRIRRSDVLHLVAEISERHVADWLQRREPLVALTATKELALEIIFRIIGVRTEEISRWRRQFGRYLLAGFPSDGRLHGPVHFIARRARDWLDARLGALVSRLRRDGDDGTLVSGVAHSRDDDGALLPLGLVVANLRLLVLAGHETTAAALAWTLLYLARSRADQARATAEATDDPIATVNDETRVTFAEQLFREALRLHPAVHSVIRRLRDDTEIAARRVPAGTLLNVPLCHLLRDPVLFPAPAEHRPERWTERPRTGTIHTAMFGGGPHFCLGYHVAMAEGTLCNLQLARALLDRGMHLAPTGPVPSPIYLPLTHPPKCATVRFERN